jgi:hypothetical protein
MPGTGTPIKTIAACERAKRLNVADEWLRPTLLAAAFDLGDPDKAAELADDVIVEGRAAWKVQSVLSDVEANVLQVSDAAKRARSPDYVVRLIDHVTSYSELEPHPVGESVPG